MPNDQPGSFWSFGRRTKSQSILGCDAWVYTFKEQSIAREEVLCSDNASEWEWFLSGINVIVDFFQTAFHS